MNLLHRFLADCLRLSLCFLILLECSPWLEFRSEAVHGDAYFNSSAVSVLTSVVCQVSLKIFAGIHVSVKGQSQAANGVASLLTYKNLVAQEYSVGVCKSVHVLLLPVLSISLCNIDYDPDAGTHCLRCGQTSVSSFQTLLHSLFWFCDLWCPFSCCV